MPIQQSTTGATAGNLNRYEKQYRDGVKSVRLYDQLATPLNETFEPRGATTYVQWFAPLVPRPDTAIGSETTDFDPQSFRDVNTSITKYFRNDGLKAHDLLRLKSSLNPEQVAGQLVGELAMNTIDALARRQATEANIVFYGDGTVSARSSLDLGTAGHHLSLSNFSRARSVFGTFQNTDSLFAIIDPWQYEDLLTTASTSITNRAGYTEEGKKIL